MTLPSSSKIFLLCLFSIGLQLAFAQPQEMLRGLNALPVPKGEANRVLSKQQQVLNLPFTDDFSYSGNQVDPSKWEVSDVWVNQTWARSPITLGVASFDGLNRFGRPHLGSQFGNDSLGDVLTSLEIDLSTASDSVYLSFYYQAGGWGEMPGAGDDSLVLEFYYAPDSNWYSFWQNEDYPNPHWNQVMQAVPDSFQRSDFRFRIRNYGSKRGALDLWHIDYVRLNDQRRYNDTVLNDVAFTRPHPSLMKDYESIPWWHVNQALNVANRFKPDLRLFYRRNSDPNLPRPNRILGEFQIGFQGSIVQQNGAPDGDLDDTHAENVEVRFPVPDTADAGRPRLNFINPPYADEFEFDLMQTYSGGSEIYSSNDTLRRKQVFKNYYAYDDGSAERAYEVRNNRGGFVVQRYDILVNDTLKGLQIYFQPALYDLEEQEFTILMISNASGLPGNIIYESDSVYTAQYTDGNFYHTYLLDTSLVGPVSSGTVFIGIRQQNSDPLSIGYDQNNRGYTSAFYGELDDMYQSFLGGTLMMRPIFRYLPKDLSNTENLVESGSLEVYPNPSSGVIKLHYPRPLKDLEQAQLKVFNLNGQELARLAPEEEIDLSHLPKGLYLLQLHSTNQQGLWQSKILIH